MIRFTNVTGVFPQFAWALTDDPLTVSSSASRTSEYDAPAVLLICESEAEQRALLAKLTEFLRVERERTLDRLPGVLAS